MLAGLLYNLVTVVLIIVLGMGIVLNWMFGDRRRIVKYSFFGTVVGALFTIVIAIFPGMGIPVGSGVVLTFDLWGDVETGGWLVVVRSIAINASVGFAIGAFTSLYMFAANREPADRPLDNYVMDRSQLDRIESALGIALPAEYRELFEDFTLHPDRVMRCEALWERPDMIIDITNTYRQGLHGSPPWPDTYLFIGGENNSHPFVIDVASDGAEVIQLDYGDPNRVIGRFGSVKKWNQSYKADVGMDSIKSKDSLREAIFPRNSP
jgi:hypothetical protein